MTFELARHEGTFINALDGTEAIFGPDKGDAYGVSLEPWDYRIFREAD